MPLQGIRAWIADGRDYINAGTTPKPGYAALAFPHPLADGAAPILLQILHPPAPLLVGFYVAKTGNNSNQCPGRSVADDSVWVLI
jgi:hypothetical protein